MDLSGKVRVGKLVVGVACLLGAEMELRWVVALQRNWRVGRWDVEVLGKRAVLEEVGLHMTGWDLEAGLWKMEAERQAELERRIVEKQVVGLGAEWGQWRRKAGQHLGKAAGQELELHSRT